MMSDIAALAELELHDATIETLRFDFGRKEIRMEIDAADDADAGKTVVLHFTGISALSLGQMLQGDDLEIYSADFTALPSGRYRASFMILLGFSMPSWEFSFEFADGGVSGGS